MKSKSLAFLLLFICIFSAALSFFLLWGREPCPQAQIYSRGEYVKTVSLLENQTFKISCPDGGSNVIQVKNGKIAVTEASCPDHHCMKRGFLNSGAPIICLPNALEIRFVTGSSPDISTN